MNAYEGLRIITFTDKAERLVGARFLIFGFVFVLYLETEGLNKYIKMFDKDGKVTPGMNMMYHLTCPPKFSPGKTQLLRVLSGPAFLYHS